MNYKSNEDYHSHAIAAEHALAVETTEKEIYRSSDRLGWASWVTTWRDNRNNLYVTYQEIRRGDNPVWEPVPLDFWEAMGLPVGYHETLCNGSKNLITDIVVLKSTDFGLHWEEISRNATNLIASFSWASLPDGKIIRSMCNDYVAWHPGDKQETWSEVSEDGGKSWERQSTIAECHNGSGCPHRLRRLRDGTLVQLISAATSYGPGRERFARHTKRQHVRQEFNVSLYFSEDNGISWDGPCCVLPAILAYEPDFVELPSGDLLILNSTVQGGPQVRQYVRKGPWGWIPGPVHDVVSGTVPECLVYAQGFIIGAVRDGIYTCSDDEGANWHTIAGLPPCGYQPFMVELPDNRLFCAWHAGGGDEFFGEKNLYVGATTFRLEADLPKLPKLVLERELNAEKDRYINSYLATVTKEGHPLSDKTVYFKYKKKNSEQWSESDVKTDANGQARFDLVEIFKEETDIYFNYEVQARVEPWDAVEESGASLIETYLAYAITSTKADLGW